MNCTDWESGSVATDGSLAWRTGDHEQSMDLNEKRIGDLYQIALTIGPDETLESTAGRALSAYLEHLDCTAGAVLERVSGDDREQAAYRLVSATPGEPQADPTFWAAIETFVDGDEERLPGELPFVHSTESGTVLHVMTLPQFGLLVLMTRGEQLDNETVAALEALNEKLAEACRGKQIEAELREERNRFGAVFETIQEPVINVVYRGGEPIIKRVNAAFEETFGYAEQEAIGRNVNELIVPEAMRGEAGELDDAALEGQTMTRELRRKTPDGIGDFLFRGAPVGTSDEHEHFAMYVDITEEKARQRKLEQLYEETDHILSGEGRKEICQRTVDAAAEIIGVSLAGVHLYDRSQEGLVPVAMTDAVDNVFDDGPRSFTDHDTVVWDVYESGEPRLIRNTETFDGVFPGGGTPVGSTIVLPLGNHGLLILSSLEVEAFDEMDFYYAKLLSTLVETALDRAQRAQGLEGIQEITRATLEATTHEEVADEVIERLPEVLDMPITGIWEYDSAKQLLEPLAVTDTGIEQVGGAPTFAGDDSIAWHAFRESRIKRVRDVSSHPDVYNEDTVLGSEIIVPIGEFGVLLSGSTYTESFNESDERLLDTLSANVETTMRLTSRRREMELLDQVLARILRHNIRNDLTIIQGFAREIQKNEDGETARQAGRIIDRCKSLQSTAEHATEIRHIVTNRDRREQLSLPDIVERVVTAARNEYPSARITANVESGADVVVHPDLPVALRHLIENGIEHNSAESPEVHVSISQTPDSVILEVADDGPGIPDHEIDVLDQHGESALEHGSGAGLWIVDRVADYSDGSLSFEPSPTGTVARLRFEK